SERAGATTCVSVVGLIAFDKRECAGKDSSNRIQPAAWGGLTLLAPFANELPVRGRVREYRELRARQRAARVGNRRLLDHVVERGTGLMDHIPDKDDEAKQGWVSTVMKPVRVLSSMRCILREGGGMLRLI